MTEVLREDVRDLQAQLERLRAEAEQLARGTSAAQLAWRPADGRWSIADNLEHLALTGRWYFKQIDRALDEAQAAGLGPGRPARLGLLMRALVWVVEPPVRRVRVRAPAGYAPERRLDAAAVLGGYAAHHQAFAARLVRAQQVDLARARARTPITRRIRVPLFACITMMLAHERRHLWQARQVRAAAGFPPA